MKNNDNHTIRSSRSQTNDKAMRAIAAELQSDPLFTPRPKTRRRKFPRYAKQIMNDPFIFNV
jgi:hypothetical protein